MTAAAALQSIAIVAQVIVGARTAANATPAAAVTPAITAQRAAAVATPAPPNVFTTPTLPAAIATQMTPAAVVKHYAAALRKISEPSVITFDYTLAQTGLRTLAQTHRVFRSGNDERDETLTVDGKRLTPPKVRIFRGRRNRYTLALLAPRPGDYRFVFVGTHKDGHHLDYEFRTLASNPRMFSVNDVLIDGVRFLPLAIDFTTGSHQGAGRISFGSNARWWVPYFATARATVAADVATEQFTFYTYRFPPSLPPTTFGQMRARPVPSKGEDAVPDATAVPARHMVPPIAPAAALPAAPLPTAVHRVLRHPSPVSTPGHPSAARPTSVPIAPGL